MRITNRFSGGVAVVSLAVALIGIVSAASGSFRRYATGSPGPQTESLPAPENEPAEKVFENIQAFKGMPAAELQGVMSFIASSLNVDCDYCHVQDFGSDKLPTKLRAREMIRMVRDINQTAFHGENKVNCFTCHKGNSTPVSIAAITLPPPRPTASTSNPAKSPQTSSLPRTDQILDHYVRALGGQEGLDRIKTRLVKFVPLRQSQGDPTTDRQMLQKEGKVLLVQISPGYNRWVGFNGTVAWAQDSDKSYWGMLNTFERNAIMRDSEIYPGSRISSQYSNLRIIGKEKLGDRDAFILSGTSPESSRETFFFDAQTGLLLRRHIEEKTIFGSYQVEANFEDYRDVDGVKVPFVVRWSSPAGSWGIRISSRITEIHNNVPMDDSAFDHAPPLPNPN